MNNAMPVLSSFATLLTVDVTMHNHDSQAGVIITRDGFAMKGRCERLKRELKANRKLNNI